MPSFKRILAERLSKDPTVSSPNATRRDASFRAASPQQAKGWAVFFGPLRP